MAIMTQKGYKHYACFFLLIYLLRRYLSILWKKHQFFIDKSFVKSTLQIVQNAIA